jgi:hypothetical protein
MLTIYMRYPTNFGLEIRECGHRDPSTLTTWHPISAKVGANFADKRRSLGWYRSLADLDHGVLSYKFGAGRFCRSYDIVARVFNSAPHHAVRMEL